MIALTIGEVLTCIGIGLGFGMIPAVLNLRLHQQRRRRHEEEMTAIRERHERSLR
jgi:hypothetical protein